MPYYSALKLYKCMTSFKEWLFTEMGYGRFTTPEGVDLVVNGKNCPGVRMADARIELWPGTDPQQQALKQKFLSYCATSPGKPFYGKIDNGYLLFIPAAFSVRFSPTPPISAEFEMPPTWSRYLLLVDGENQTLYGQT